MSESNINEFDQISFRRALGGFGTGVALIAADDAEGQARGLIVNSFTSVSLDPPIILWCIAETSRRYDVFAEAEDFSVNFLRWECGDLARTFAKDTDAVFDPDVVERLATGAPVYAKALASLDCTVRWREKAGDHVVVFATVKAVKDRDGDEALGYFKGGYTKLLRQN